ncbi:CDP-alcohol phosphatidyltransferase family protein [Amycolatopsis granulosa]|uniref:CDP-alcohol phosphatidyltransferase family protein n=1 Tax=Amycolatopsis granulosa TaxID=185684 RepID=UPI00141FD9CC|nr:CDP-alcohol phosphatidyltransferase family protein [Amycolatopsis granulosa]NIH83688.1 phosphatidylglycerophosphate synthase [Amycolatopsis granulosa]
MIVQTQPRTIPARQEQAVAAGALLVLVSGLALTVGLTPAAWVAGAGYGGALWVLLTGALRRAGRVALGPADRVTLARATLTGGVLALVAAGSSGPVPAGLAALALALDAVDGRVARRTATVSPLGARFDLEADAVLILVLCVPVAVVLGPWVLLIGAMRYAFVAAGWVLPWLRGPLAPDRARKAVAAAQGVTLLVVVAGVLPRGAALAGTAVALAALVWSFGRDVRTLWRTR